MYALSLLYLWLTTLYNLWAVISFEEHKTYMDALEQASAYANIEPFAKFVGNMVSEAIEDSAVAEI